MSSVEISDTIINNLKYNHNHSGGGGEQISYLNLSNLPTIPITESIYIQSTTPTVSPGTAYLWIDTTGGDLQFWVEDGL